MKKQQIEIKKTNKTLIKPKKKKLKWFFLGLFWIILVIFIFLFTLKSLGFLNFTKIVQNVSWISAEKIKDLKKKNGRINILVVWRWWMRNDAPNLTDSIILVSIIPDKKIVTMFSIPRDLYVKYGKYGKWKINEIYAYSLRKYWKVPKAMWILEEKIEEITWEKINYYINLDFNWFVNIVDNLWWLTINVPETIVDRQYPRWIGYTTFILRKWERLIDWETALKYARSRHSTSDFDRSKRQQIIIKALKEKINDLWFFESAWTVKDFYSSYKTYFKTDLTFKEVASIWLYLKEIPKENIVSFNLNNSCSFGWTRCKTGWFLYVPARASFWWLSVLLPEWANYKNISNYDLIQKFTNIIFNYPELYINKTEIWVYNSVWIPGLASRFAWNLKKYWFSVKQKNIWNVKDKKYNETVINYNNIKKYNKTFIVLQFFLFGNIEKTDFPIYSEDNETKIEIIIWEDYKELIKTLEQ